MLKTMVLSARNGGFRIKKRRFLKLIHVLDYQQLWRNAKNKRFSSTNDNSPANIGCMYA